MNMDNVSKKDMGVLVVKIVEAVNKLKESLVKEVQDTVGYTKNTSKSLETALKSLETRLIGLISKSTKESQDKAYKELNNAVYNLEKTLSELPHFDPVKLEEKWGVVVSDMDKAMKEMCGREHIKKELESYRGDARLDKSAIKGIDKLEEKVNEIELRPFVGKGGTSVGIQLFVDGVRKGRVSTVNLIAGTGISLSHNAVGQRNDITITASSAGAFTVLTATGTVNGNNASFTFASKPTLVISDGASYIENVGWTWTAGTLTVTMTIPPQSNIYGLS